MPLGAASATLAATQPDPRAATAGANVLAGTLIEQIAEPPYVYLRLKKASGGMWAAAKQATLPVGAAVTIYNAILREKFESKTLHRTFDRVYFGTLEARGSAPTGGTGLDATAASVGTPPAVDAKVGKIERASGVHAHTIGELWTQKDALLGKTVSIRGVVVKYNPGVMGENWIHLQDGSGDLAKGTHGSRRYVHGPDDEWRNGDDC
jgi:hypothetical protein